MPESKNAQSTEAPAFALYRLNHPGNIKTIRDALLIGLASLGEIERLQGSGVEVVHPTGCNDTVREFANALMTLDDLAELPLAA